MLISVTDVVGFPSFIVDNCNSLCIWLWS